MDTIVNQVKSLAAAADDRLHRELVDKLRDLLFSVEGPEDAAHRLIFGQQQLAVVRAAQQSRLIEMLVERQREPVPVEKLSASTGASPLLVERLLRYMAAMGMVRQPSENSYAANKTTEALNMPGIKAGMGFGMDIVSPSAQALPSFLAQTQYQNPSSIQSCPWYSSHDSKLNCWQFLHANPATLKEFNMFMTHQRLNSNSWLDTYPVNLQHSAEVLLVDVGGGVGHMCAALKERYPAAHGRVVLQDLPTTISNLPPSLSFESMVYDYYTEQPIIGAKYYYFRNILHNLTDESAKKVLENTKIAMGPDSKVLIDEVVVPKVGAHWRTVQLDMLMMSALGAVERTEEQFRSLFESAGLELAGIHVYDEVQGDAVLEVTLTKTSSRDPSVDTL